MSQTCHEQTFCVRDIANARMRDYPSTFRADVRRDRAADSSGDGVDRLCGLPYLRRELWHSSLDLLRCRSNGAGHAADLICDRLLLLIDDASRGVRTDRIN
jgi:hypothetical protein